MPRDGSQSLEERVVRAAEAALADHGYVSLIDLFTGMRLLYAGHVEAWRKGRLDVLEPWIQGKSSKDRSLSMSPFPGSGRKQKGSAAQRDSGKRARGARG